jgi:phosphoglycerate dehydrogenase-like enzyme
LIANKTGEFKLNRKVALEPKQFPAYLEAIEKAGGVVSPLSGDVTAMVWTDYADVAGLERTIAENPQLKWIQLPFAGVDAFAKVLQNPITFTSAKGSYAEPVAEHALALCLALGRKLPDRVRAVSWGKKFADSLYHEDVLIVGGGGIAEEFAKLLEPFRSRLTVVRKRPTLGFAGNAKVVGFADFESEISKAKFVVLACALTDETRFLLDERAFSLMREDAYLVNIARGEVVDQIALQKALESGQIAAAATDVTYPEPLPEESPLWQLDNLLITPHTADTMPIVTRLFSERLRVNVSAWISGEPLTGLVDPDLGY